MERDELHKIIHSVIDDESPAVRKSVIIGIGGSGVRGALSAKEWIEGNVPAGALRYMRWIGIDTGDPGTGMNGKAERYRFPSDRFFLEERRMLYLTSPAPADLSPELLRDKKMNDPVFSWLPDPDACDISTAWDRSNQARPVGRLAFFYNEKRIRDALAGEVEKLSGLPDDPGGFRLMDVKEEDGKRGAQISVFITASIACGTGSGMFLDIAATVRDIFKDYWPRPKIYGILLLPPEFKSAAHRRSAKANAYAALKEIDFFMNGNTFRAEYPSGRRVEIPDRIFDDGMLYLLEAENMAGSSLKSRSQAEELAGQLISTFVSSIVGGAIEERAAQDSANAPVFLPAGEKSQRRGNYNSFGISRAIYPVPQLRDIGYSSVALRMIDSFLKKVNSRLLLETTGDISRGLVRALRLDCRLIFERMYPDYIADIEADIRSCRERLDSADARGEERACLSLMESIVRDYSREEMEKIKGELLPRMEMRGRIELDRMNTVLVSEVRRYMRDRDMGFLFAERVIDVLLAKLDIYQRKYCQERVALARYSAEDMKKLLEAAEESDARELADAVIQMASFNFSQLLYESMLLSAEGFARDFRSLLLNIRESEIRLQINKVSVLRDRLKQEIEDKRSEILDNKNPFFLYLINDDGIDAFLEKHFYSRLSIEDLRDDVEFLNLDREEDAGELIETYLISTEGVKILGLGDDEISSMIEERFGGLLGKPVDEVKSLLFEECSGESGLSDDGMFLVDIEVIRREFFRIICSRLKGFNFENISVRDILSERGTPLSEILEKLDTKSRPYIYLDATGLGLIENYSVITDFELNTHEEWDDPADIQNDLPSRLSLYSRREASAPDLSVETFEVPYLCRPYEIISTGMLTGYPIFRVNSLHDSAKYYHELVAGGSHLLHLFNSPEFDAKYFPDPFRFTNYLNPAKLWSGLILLKILEERRGAYHFEDKLSEQLREIEARENYRYAVLELEKKIGGYGDMAPEVLAEAVNGLGLLAKSPADGKLQFRREYSPAIMDILEWDGSGEKAADRNVSGDENNNEFARPPKFADLGELALFFENERAVREFVTTSVRSVFERTRGNITAGADIALPKWKIEQSVLPVFRDRFEFYDYFEKRGSLEWQNLLSERLADKLNEYISSSRFRLESAPDRIDRGRVAEFVRSLEQRMPDIVLWEVKVRSGIVS